MKAGDGTRVDLGCRGRAMVLCGVVLFFSCCAALVVLRCGSALFVLVRRVLPSRHVPPSFACSFLSRVGLCVTRQPQSIRSSFGWRHDRSLSQGAGRDADGQSRSVHRWDCGLSLGQEVPRPDQDSHRGQDFSVVSGWCAGRFGCLPPWVVRFMFGGWAVQGLSIAGTWAENIKNFTAAPCCKVMIADPKDQAIPNVASLRTAVALKVTMAGVQKCSVDAPPLHCYFSFSPPPSPPPTRLSCRVGVKKRSKRTQRM